MEKVHWKQGEISADLWIILLDGIQSHSFLLTTAYRRVLQRAMDLAAMSDLCVRGAREAAIRAAFSRPFYKVLGPQQVFRVGVTGI